MSTQTALPPRSQSLALADAHIAANTRIQEVTAAAAAAAWLSLGSYDEADVPTFLNRVVPLVLAAQRQVAMLTAAYLAVAIGRRARPVDFDRVTGAGIRTATPEVIEASQRGGLALAPDATTVPLEIVYRRPFVETWAALAKRTPFEAALDAARERVEATAAMDVQNAMRHTLRLVGERESDVIVGWARVPDADACPFCRLIAGRRYLVSDLLPVHARCVVGDTMVWASGSPLSPSHGAAKRADLGSAQAATRRRYEGQIVVLKTAAGHELTVTPNHPILTARGWVDAGLLREGDGVISSRRADGVVGGIPHEQNVPARIEDVFRAHGVGRPVRVPFAAEHFHGDIGHGEVDVVFPDGRLDARVLAAFAQPSQHMDLTLGFRRGLGLPCTCGSRLHSGAVRASTFRGMGRTRTGFAFGGRLLTSRYERLLRGGALADASFGEMAVDHAPTDAEALREFQHGLPAKVTLDRACDGDAFTARQGFGSDESAAAEFLAERRDADTRDARGLILGLAGQIHTDRVVQARSFDWCGDVFNLVTRGGWYTANGVVTHNCRCGVEVITESNRAQFTGKLANDLALSPDGLVKSRVVSHGELGPLLVNGAHDFTDALDLAA